MKKILATITILIALIVLLYTTNMYRSSFARVYIEDNTKFCYPNASTQNGKVFFVVNFSLTNKTNKAIKFKVKILPKDKELNNLIGKEAQLIKENQITATGIYEIKANTTQSIAGIIPTEIPETRLDKITHGFKDFDILLYNDKGEKLYR